MSLMPVEDALSTLLADAPTLDVERISLESALNRVLAEPITASVNVPPLDNSAMDGYALRAADLADGKSLRVSQRIAAGEVGSALEPNTCARIFTGAPVPEGADAIEMQENVSVVGDVATFNQSVRSGQHIRPAGQDFEAGNILVEAGVRMRASHLGVISATGVTEVVVRKKPNVAILSTGDELVEPGGALAEGQIYNSNRPMLAALLRGMGCDVIDGGIVLDDADATAKALLEAAQHADLVITSGGVSVGEEDHVKSQVEQLGRLQLWKLAIKPGKPVAYGRIAETPFLGLPGNPASSFVTFLLLAKPYLLRMQSVENVEPKAWPVKADFEWPRAGTRQEYLRAKVSFGAAESGLQQPVVSLYKNQSSGVLLSTAWANALVVLSPGVTVEPGDKVPVILFDELLH